jgi:DNA-binding Lrp family transcriptional regulator
MTYSRRPKPKIDRLDMRILAAIAERGRQTITELSKSVGLSISPCTVRLESLEANAFIRGYHADIDVERLGDLSLYWVTVAAKPWTPDLARKLEAVMTESPYIVSAEALFGSLDYVLRIYARSTQHYHEIMQPFLQYNIDFETWPVSRRVAGPNLHRLVSHLKSEAN